MSNYNVSWNRTEGIDAYSLYVSDAPGSTYTLLATTQQVTDPMLPGYMHPSYEYYTDMRPLGLVATQVGHHMSVHWEQAESGLPYTFKVVASGYVAPPSDQVALHGSIATDAEWIPDREATFSDIVMFHNEPALIATGGNSWPRITIPSRQMHSLIVWVMIDPSDMPQAIWIECRSGGSWEHRVYFGADIAPEGLSGTPSLNYGGPLPSAGCWTPLIVRLPDMNIANIDGIGFGVPDGKSIHIGAVCCSDCMVLAARQPHIRVIGYRVYRDDQLIATTSDTYYDDIDAVDIDTSPARNWGVQFQQLEPTDAGERVMITWSAAGSGGTYYEYAVASIAENLEESSLSVCAGIVDDSYGYINIYHDTAPITPENPGTLLAQVAGSTYTHSGVEADTTHWYRFDIYDSSHALLQSSIFAYHTLSGCALDSFILDDSALA